MAVLNEEDAEVANWTGRVRGRRWTMLGDDRIPPLAVPGGHNRLNARLAAAAARAAGCSTAAVERGLANFRPLAGRLEPVAEVQGRTFYNDTTATTPESTIAALAALEEPVWLVAGGGEKGCEIAPLVLAIVAQARGAAFYGAVRERLYQDVAAAGADFPCSAVETLDEALRWCWDRSQPGEAILLSPGFSSHDQFRNFRDRGERFVELVAELDRR
jgi:UDP-N-acetylmuramoylalanine--D-glutamate ligase